MRWLVCGGRDFLDREYLSVTLNALVSKYGEPKLLIQGGARGADTLAEEWALERGTHVAEVRANWQCYGKRAGYLRNAAMLYLQPDLVVCFPGGKGTEMMYQLAKEARITTERF